MFFLAVVVFFAVASSQYDVEMQIRKTFIAYEKVHELQQKLSRETQITQGLIESVVPRPILDSLSSTDSSAQPYFAEPIELTTTLVASVVGFDELYKSLPPQASVRLLNALFARFEELTRARGLVPLKTFADEFIVVGNMLKDADDHAERVTQLGCDMVASMEEFNRTHNPLPDSVSIRVGIHTDASLVGVVKMKCLHFDCWGNGVPFAEQISTTAGAPNTVVVTDNTRAALKARSCDTIALRRIGVARMSNADISLFVASSTEADVHGKQQQLSDFSLDQSVEAEAEPAVFGVQIGAPDEADRAFALEFGFLPPPPPATSPPALSSTTPGAGSPRKDSFSEQPSDSLGSQGAADSSPVMLM